MKQEHNNEDKHHFSYSCMQINVSRLNFFFLCDVCPLKSTTIMCIHEYILILGFSAMTILSQTRCVVWIHTSYSSHIRIHLVKAHINV